jgi:Type ISP C-terminal specificity domain
MRHSLLSDFQSAFFLDLRGDMNRDPGMLHDDNVFDIQQGVGIGIYCRKGSSPPASLVVQTHELRGARSEKSDWLSAHSCATTNWTAVTSASELFSFLDLSGSADNEYRRFVPLNRFFELGNVGYQTHRDEFVIDLDRKELIERLVSFGQASGDEAQLAKRFGVRSNRDWSLLSARKSLKQDKQFDQHVVKTLYRPFDIRHICYVPYLIDYDRHQLMDHMQRGNVGLLVSKVFDEHEFTSVLVTRWIVESKAADRTRGSYLFPLRLIQDSEHLQFEGSGVGKWRTNLQSEGAFRLTKQLGVDLHIGDVATDSGAITDIQVLNYIYAILHSPSYRLRYIEFLKSDFPRIPIPRELKMLRSLVVLGGELTDLHLLEAAMLENSGVIFVGKHPLIEKVSWSHGTVWLDKNCTVGFENVAKEVWGFHVGGYNVCEKWLKDRKGRILSKKDVIHYQKIVAALEETIRVMKKIDEVIEAYGGWSAAFVQGDGTTEGALVRLAHPKSTGAAYRKTPSQLLEAAEPEVPPYETAPLTELDAIRPNPDELDREDLICRIRQLFGDGQERERETAIDALARELGYQRTGTRIHEELDNALRTAVRRGVLTSERGTVCLFARTIEQYDRDFLKEQFLASLLGRQWIEREDAVRAFARWMGFRRTGPAIEDTARSLINGLLREGRLESNGSEIRKSMR